MANQHSNHMHYYSTDIHIDWLSPPDLPDWLKGTTPMTDTTEQIAAKKRAIARIEAEIKALEKKSKRPKDNFADGTVVRFTKAGWLSSKYGSVRAKELTYAAVKGGGKWWLTSRNHAPFTWDALLDFAGDVEIELLSRNRIINPKSNSRIVWHRSGFTTPDPYDYGYA